MFPATEMFVNITEVLKPDKLFSAYIEETNGEQQYRHKLYIGAPSMPEAERIAFDIAKNWYFNAKLGDLGWEIDHGGVIWELDGPYPISAADIQIYTSADDTKQAWFRSEEIIERL